MFSVRLPVRQHLRKNAILMLAGALVLAVALVAIPPFFQCAVPKEKVLPSALEAFVLPTTEGYAVVVRFNVTNLSDCQLTAQSVSATLRNATNKYGEQVQIGITESQPLRQLVKPGGGSAQVSYAFDQHLDFQPIKLGLSIFVNFAEAGSILVFDGELNVPSQ